MSLLDRHLGFVEALRRHGLPVSLAEGLDGARAVQALGLEDRETLRAAYAATLVKRDLHRPAFDRIFDLYFPATVGGWRGTEGEEPAADGPGDLASFRERLGEAMRPEQETEPGEAAGEAPGEAAAGDPMTALAREAVERFGRIRGRGPGEQRWSAYNTMNRVAPGELVDRVLRGLLGELDEEAADPLLRRRVEARARDFERRVEADVSRRAAELRGPDQAVRHTVRRSVDTIDFTSARKSDLEEMRRQIQPLARRLASHRSRHERARGRGPVDFRQTVRASLSYGGVPLEVHHRPRHPGRTELVVLCDVSGSVASFANFTLMLVFALREQFSRVRAFMFVDDLVEVTDRFTVGADPVDTMAELAAAARHASVMGRTQYGRAFTRFAERYPDALTPRTHLLVLGDARSNYSDLALPVVRRLVYEARRCWWLNPEHPRQWGVGDSAADEYAELISMVECRNLTQLGQFVHQLA